MSRLTAPTSAIKSEAARPITQATTTMHAVTTTSPHTRKTGSARRYHALLCGCALLAQTALALPALAADKPVLHWCLDHLTIYHEFNQDNRHPSGPAVLFMQQLATRAGFELQISNKTPAARCLKMMESGAADLMTQLYSTPEREQSMWLFRFSAKLPEMLLMRQHDNKLIHTVADLQKLTLGTIRNYSLPPVLQQLLAALRPGQRIEFDSIPQALDVLAKGRIDAVLLPSAQGTSYLQQKNQQTLFRRVALPVALPAGQGVHVALSRKTRYPELRQPIADAVAAMLQDGTVSRLFDPQISALQQKQP